MAEPTEMEKSEHYTQLQAHMRKVIARIVSRLDYEVIAYGCVFRPEAVRQVNDPEILKRYLPDYRPLEHADA